ncbi:MAG TPA: cellulose biosynthesis protein BcsG, partial [Elusimicrobiales bacterium]|nr:cellulose biosynthesis protein BcsG [Elusimicrobiales bacterium]
SIIGKMRRLTAAAAAMAAAALVWQESYLPPFKTLVSFIADPYTRPTFRYIAEFIRQSFDPWFPGAASVIGTAVYIAHRKRPIALALAAYVMLASAWIIQPRLRAAAAGGRTADAFYAEESERKVAFKAPAPGARPFDILILHICSLSWQDLKDSDYDISPFLSGFDYVFTSFGGATSYSGPSALRVLKSACGQMPHNMLYADSAPECYLMDKLRGTGYLPFTMLSHDGKYAHFAEHIQKYGRAAAPLGTDGLPVKYLMFDGTRLFPDGEALDKFWTARQASGAARAALYYNTDNLHIGTHVPGEDRGPDDASAYRLRLSAMLAEISGFLEAVDRSGRSAMVIFVPEHGAALSGSRIQAKDVREIPLPA